MKKRLKIISLIFLLLLVLLELISAPLEWFWPYSRGGNTHWKGRSDLRQIALTFDDGPSGYTPAILDILAAEGIPATFFVMGQQAERYPELLQRMVAEGHQIENHTYSFVAKQDPRWFYSLIERDQVRKNQVIIEALSGTRPRYFRPPGGQLGRNLWNAVRRDSLTVVLGAMPMPHPKWDADRQLKTAISTLEAGAILILHDGDDAQPDSDRPAATVEMLPLLIKEIRQRNFEIVSLDKILAVDSAK